MSVRYRRTALSEDCDDCPVYRFSAGEEARVPMRRIAEDFDRYADEVRDMEPEDDHPVRRNPELMIVRNPGRSKKRRSMTWALSVRHRRPKMRRKRARNFPITGKFKGKRLSYKSFIKAFFKSGRRGGRKLKGKTGMRRAAAAWKRLKKFHGRTPLSKLAGRGRRRRRKARNSWRGHKRAHSRAAKKGWRRRKARGSRRKSRRSRKARGRSRSRRTRRGKRCRKGTWKALVRRYGVKGAKKHYRKCKRSRRK